MVEVLYKKIWEEHKTLYHSDTNDFDYTKPPLLTTKNMKPSNASKLDGRKSDKIYYFNIKKISHDKEDFLKEYGNLLCEVISERKTVVVEKEDDKVRMSCYLHNTLRKVGKKYFAKEYSRLYLTFNLKTNNFYITKVFKPIGARQSRSVKCNYFWDIENIIHTLSVYRFPSLDNDFYNIFLNAIDDRYKFNITPEEFANQFTKIYVERNNIKGPNEIVPFMIRSYPGKKWLKKNDNNIVHALLDYMGLKTKYFISVMNNYKPELSYLIKYTQMLGPKYVRTINKEFFSIERTPYYTSYDKPQNINLALVPSLYDEITDNDRRKIVKIINDFTSRVSGRKTINMRYDRNLSGLIDDHLRIISKLRKFEKDIKLQAETITSFDNEHINYSEKYNLYRNSEEIYYQYGDDLINELKKSPNGCDYVLLTTDMEYIDESSYQSNCVRTYIDKFNSIIISVRKGNERVTTEFNYKGKCVQKRGRFNENPSEHMMVYVNELEDKICRLYNEDKLKPANIKIYNKVTGKTNVTTIESLSKENYKRNNGGELDFMDYLDDEFEEMLFN